MNNPALMALQECRARIAGPDGLEKLRTELSQVQDHEAALRAKIEEGEASLAQLDAAIALIASEPDPAPEPDGEAVQ